MILLCNGPPAGNSQKNWKDKLSRSSKEKCCLDMKAGVLNCVSAYVAPVSTEMLKLWSPMSRYWLQAFPRPWLFHLWALPWSPGYAAWSSDPSKGPPILLDVYSIHPWTWSKDCLPLACSHHHFYHLVSFRVQIIQIKATRYILQWSSQWESGIM